MACARCDFSTPKPSAKAQRLEATDAVQRRLALAVQRRLALIPLTDAERTAIAGDQQAFRRWLERLADTPTPAGPTPRELANSADSSQHPNST